MLFRVLVILSASLVLSNCTKGSKVSENSIQYPMRLNLSSLDPAQASNEATNEVGPNINETLLQYHFLKRPLTVEPLLAAGMPTVSKDGLVHTFKIKQGVKFHDDPAFKDGKGREMVAADFIYGWKRLADPNTKSEGWWIFDGKIKGLNEWRDKLVKGEATYDTPVEGLQTPDDYTIVITLAKPYYQLYYVLTMIYSSPVPKEAVEKYGAEFLNHPVGTGPFVFVSWIRGNKITLKRNPNYHGSTYPTTGEAGDQEAGLLADAGKTLPFVDELIFHEVPEDQPRWLNMMRGNFDLSEIPKDSFDGAVDRATMELKPEMTAKGFVLRKFRVQEIVYMGFNMDDPVIGKNKNLRLALCYAYDQKTPIDRFYNGRAIVAHSLIGPDMDGYDENFKLPCKEFSIEKAKEHMKKAGFPDGKGLAPIEYSFPTSTTGRQFAEYVQQSYEKIGVKMTLAGHSWPQFQDRLRNKKAQMFGIAWGADYPDAENMMQLLYGPNSSPGPNSANFKNKEFDKLYQDASKLPPGEARTAIYKKMRDIFAAELPWIPTVHRMGYQLSHGWVENLKPNKTLPNQFKYMKVNLAKKKELKAKL
jgi:oligopeptide transport system substrate-binding protein